MPNKWLTWSPKTANPGNIEPTKPIEGTSVGVGSPEHLPRYEGGPTSVGFVGVFPHCPRCASYYLYRPNNASNYECQSCVMRDITEEIARRVI